MIDADDLVVVPEPLRRDAPQHQVAAASGELLQRLRTAGDLGEIGRRGIDYRDVDLRIGERVEHLPDRIRVLEAGRVDQLELSAWSPSGKTVTVDFAGSL